MTEALEALDRRVSINKTVNVAKVGMGARKQTFHRGARGRGSGAVAIVESDVGDEDVQSAPGGDLGRLGYPSMVRGWR